MKDENPSVCIIDSQSVKTILAKTEKGFDGGKKIKGRKKHLLVDTLGFIHSVVVHEANFHDSVASKLVFWKKKNKMTRLKLIFADKGYSGQLISYVRHWFDWMLLIVSHMSKTFEILPFRWIVERTFSWLNNYRINSKDYNYQSLSTENEIYISMLHLMLRRIAQ